MIKKWCVYVSFLPILLSGCAYKQEYQIKNEMQSNPTITPAQPAIPHKTVTIWVHGTRFSQHILKNYFRSIPGLQSPLAYNKSNNQFDIAMALSGADPMSFPLDDMRMFGWSGILSHEARKKAAADLYTELLQISADYEKKHGFKPDFNLMTHSHGGNLAQLLREEAQKHKEKITINKLIMLACPVQQATMGNLKDPMFKKIISIYSAIDFIQVIDPQGLYKIKSTETCTPGKNCPLFSNRRFPPQDNLLQIKVKKHGHGLSHLSFIQKPFLSALPHLLNYLETVPEGKSMKRFHSDGFKFSPVKKNQS